MIDDDRDDSGNKPVRPTPERTLSPEEMQAVVRRATELQAQEADGGSEGISEAELVAIGGELGLDAAMVRRAMTEVQIRPDEGNVFMRAMGPRFPSGRRVVQENAEELASILEQYLEESEQMVPARRSGGRTRYLRDRRLSAVMRRVRGQFTRKYRPLNLEAVEVGVSPMDDETALVEVAGDLRNVRLGLTIASVTIGVTGSLPAFLINSVTDPWFALGPALLVAPWLGFKAIYSVVRSKTQERVESLLDRIQYGELE